MKTFLNKHKPLICFAAVSKEHDNIKKASSGGMFFELGKRVLEQNGVVFGCVLQNDGSCSINSAKTIKQLTLMQGSKCVFTYTKESFRECYGCLCQKVKVLYVALPCQVAGFMSFLQKKDLPKDLLDNLVTVDLFCLGTPSQKLFKKYIKWLNVKHKTDSGIYVYKFRNKDKGWGSNFLSYRYLQNNKEIVVEKIAIMDLYYNAFLNLYSLMSRCYQCEFSTINRVSDISIGDFWDITNSEQEFFDKHKKSGISAVLVNTKKGEEIFEDIKNKLYIKKSSLTNIKQASIDVDSKLKISKLKKAAEIHEKINECIQHGDTDKLFSEVLKPKINIRPPLTEKNNLIKQIFINWYINYFVFCTYQNLQCRS